MGRGCPTKINVSSSWSRARLGEELEIRRQSIYGKEGWAEGSGSEGQRQEHGNPGTRGVGRERRGHEGSETEVPRDGAGAKGEGETERWRKGETEREGENERARESVGRKRDT